MPPATHQMEALYIMKNLTLLLPVLLIFLSAVTPLSALADDPHVDSALTWITPLPDTDLVVVREQFYGASGVDLSAYGIDGGPHDFVQSLYFRLFVDTISSNTDFYSGLIILPESITILGVISDGNDLGGASSDGIFTESDELFGVGTNPDLYAGNTRGFETSGTASGEFIGIIDAHTFAFGLNVGRGLDDFRIIIDYGDSFDSDLSFDILAVDATPPGDAEPVIGIHVGDVNSSVVFGSGDYGEISSLLNIPLTALVPAVPGEIIPFDPEASLYIARDPTGSTQIDSYDTNLNVPLPGQFVLDTNLPNPRGITEHDDGLIYCCGRDGGFAVMDPVARTEDQALMADLDGNVIDATNLPGHPGIFSIRNVSGDSQIDVIDPDVPIVINTFSIVGPNTPVAIVDGADGLLYVLSSGGILASCNATGGDATSIDLDPPTGSYDGVTSRSGTPYLYLLRNTSGDTMIDIYNTATSSITFDFASLPIPTSPADITDGPGDRLYVIGDGFGGPAGYTVVDANTGAVIYSHEIMDFQGTYRSITGLLPQSSASPVGPTPQVTELRHLAYPNPFNPRVEIRFELAEPTQTRVEILDVRGRIVRLLAQETGAPGWNFRIWDGCDTEGRALSSGTYFYRIDTGSTSAVGKMVLVR